MQRGRRDLGIRYVLAIALAMATLLVARLPQPWIRTAVLATLAFAGLMLAWIAHRRRTSGAQHRSEIAAYVAQLQDARERASTGEAHTRAMLDSSLDAIIMIDQEGRVVEWNAAAEQTFKYTRGEAMGRQMAELIIPESLRASHIAGVARHLRTGEAKILGRRLEMPARRADGSEFPVELTVVRVSLPGKPLFTGFVRDLSARRRAEEALRISDERLRLLAESSTDVVYRYRVQPTRGFDYVSPAATKVLGYSPEEHYADPDFVNKVIHPGDRYLLDSIVGRGTGGQPVELRWVRKDGTVVYVEHQDTAIYDERGDIVAVHGIARDVTDRRRRENGQSFLAQVGGVLASTLDTEETMASVAEAVVASFAGCCIIEISTTSGGPRLVKVAHADPSKASVAKALERILLDRAQSPFVGDVLDDRRPILRSELSSRDLESDQMRLLRELDPVSYIRLPLLARGRLVGTLSLLSSDPSRRYDAKDLEIGKELAHRTALAIESAELYRAAQQAIQARDDVLSIVAHDLRNPLSAARLAATDIARRLPNDAASAPVRKGADRIGRSIDRANGLIQDLLDVAQIEAGSLSVERARVAAQALIGEAAETFKPMASEASLELTTDVPAQLPDVLADASRVLQVFSNVVANAIKFTPSGGLIRLCAIGGDGEVRFRVEDTGPGIPPDQLPHLFDRFWQAKQGDRRGAGLGLPIAKGIVEAHGGRLWVESTPGHGSTFCFTLPTAPALEVRSEKTAPQRL